MKWWTFNIVTESTSYPLFFECETRQQCEQMLIEAGLVVDEAGVCEMVEVMGVNDENN